MNPLQKELFATVSSEWCVDRLKDVVSLRNEKTILKSEALDYVELEDIESGSGRLLRKRNTLDVESAVTIFCAGDVLYGKLRPYLEKYAEVDFDGKCTGEILALKPEGIAGSFLRYCIASPWFTELCSILAYGTKMPRINWPTQLSTLDVPIPSNDEQSRIAMYLDASSKRVDAVVVTKRAQVDLLAFSKKAELHAVFSSKRWPRERIKDVTLKIGSGVTPEGGSTGYLDEGVPLLRSQNVHFDGLRLDDVAYISFETHAEMSNSQLRPYDVLINITGASIGRCTFVPSGLIHANVNQHVCIMRPSHRVNHEFLAHFLASPFGQGEVFSGFTGASRQGLSHSDLGVIALPLPTLKEQLEAVARINQFFARADAAIACIEEQIEALMSYRKSLIHECVTGQRRISDEDVNRVTAHAASLAHA